MAALYIRNHLMDATRSEKNTIDFDRVPKPKKLNDFLPDALKE